MSERYVYYTTYEETEEDGTVVASVELRIHYNFFYGHSGYFNYVTGDCDPPCSDESEFVKVEMQEPDKSWVNADDRFAVWADLFVCDNQGELADHARNWKRKHSEYYEY